MVGFACGHGWRGFDRRVLSAEIVVHERHGQHVAVIFQLLAKCVRAAREAPIAHADGQI